MTCPVCGGKTTVADSRSECDEVMRKRRCTQPDCGYIFHTVELEKDLLERLVKENEQWNKN